MNFFVNNREGRMLNKYFSIYGELDKTLSEELLCKRSCVQYLMDFGVGQRAAEDCAKLYYEYEGGLHRIAVAMNTTDTIKAGAFAFLLTCDWVVAENDMTNMSRNALIYNPPTIPDPWKDFRRRCDLINKIYRKHFD